MGQMEVSPVTECDRPAGVAVTNISSGNILSKMRITNDRIVTRINDEIPSSHEQLSAFIQGMKEEGEFTLTVMNRWVRRRSQVIHLEVK